MVGNDWIWIIPLLPLAGFITISLLNKRLPHAAVSVLAPGVVLLAFLLAVRVFFWLLSDPNIVLSTTALTWFSSGGFSVSFSLIADRLSGLMMLIITGVGFLIHVYSVGYMHGDEGYNRFFSYLNLFIFFMLILVMGSNYLLMFVGWEGVGLCSYLLIGFWFRNQDYNDAAKKAFIMNRIGDLGMILGIILIFVHFGSIAYEDVFPAAANVESVPPIITLIAILLFIGAIGKSAQIPLFTWLPDAMAGPTPVSALIHAATMVTAGVYMIARSNILYTLSPLALDIVAVTGVVTALMAATIALRQNDIKKVLAYSTVSQLGLMFVAMGTGAYATGMFHMMTHAFFKALLFLGAGSVIHAMAGEQDIRRMGGLAKHLPVTWLTFLIATLAISGIPPLSGFFSKDEILANAFADNLSLWIAAAFTSLLTVFYMFRLLFLTFKGTPRMSEDVKKHLHESPRSMTIPLIVLAVLSVAGGWVNIPEVLGGGHAFSNYLAPVFADSQRLMEQHHVSHGTELTLMGVIVTLTVVVIVLAYREYVRMGRVPEPDEAKLRGVARLLNRKYFIDEIYEALIVRPLFLLSTVLYEIVDRALVDRVVNSTGGVVRGLGQAFRKVQTGNTGFYVFVMAAAVLLLITLKMLVM
ncbi:MAG: NADH-quinone oxidoreductase subunit L [Bacteroidota bacterium]|jgi:NADH-quinone oxidoreductase subunit L